MHFTCLQLYLGICLHCSLGTFPHSRVGACLHCSSAICRQFGTATCRHTLRGTDWQSRPPSPSYWAWKLLVKTRGVGSNKILKESFMSRHMPSTSPNQLFPELHSNKDNTLCAALTEIPGGCQEQLTQFDCVLLAFWHDFFPARLLRKAARKTVLNY